VLPAGPFSFAGVFAPQIVAVRTFELNMSWIIWHLVDKQFVLRRGINFLLFTQNLAYTSWNNACEVCPPR
jgi:hypothetical protein